MGRLAAASVVVAGIVCCAALPAVIALVGGLTLAAVFGVAGAIAALAAIGAVVARRALR